MKRVYKESAAGPTSGEVAEKKKIQNRLSQQAFRKRQSDYIRELEKRIENFHKSDNERISILEKENVILREQLNKIVLRLDSADSGLRSLSQSAKEALRYCDNHKVAVEEITALSPESSWQNFHADAPAPPPSLSTSKDAAKPAVIPLPHSSGLGPTILCQGTGFKDMEGADVSNQSLTPKSFETDSPGRREAQQVFDQTLANPLLSAPLLQPGSYISSIPGVWSYHYQMGPKVFQSAVSMNTSTTGCHKGVNSHFSDHIYALQQFLRRKWTSGLYGECPTSNLQVLQMYASLLLSIFNTVARPSAMSWYNLTKFHDHIAKVTIWQICRTREMYTFLPAKYKPSALQLTEAYPAIIDWHPFSSVRDKLILFHAANPCIDRLIGELGTAYVVETDLSQLVRMEQPTFGYVRVWDIIQAMGDSEDCLKDDPIPASPVATQSWNISPEQPGNRRCLCLPAPNAEALFSTREYAHLAFKALRMAEGVSIFKLDPIVFETYPELYDPDCPFIASGMPLRPSVQTMIPGPTPLDASILDQYHHFAGWAFDVISQTPQFSRSSQ